MHSGIAVSCRTRSVGRSGATPRLPLTGITISLPSERPAGRRLRPLLPGPTPNGGEGPGDRPGTDQRILKITARCTTKLMTVAVPCAMP